MTLFGPDGSHWQFRPKSSVDLELSADDWGQIAFVIWRSSIGFRQDATFARMRDAAIGNDKAFCAYHWVYPTGKYDARGQAEAMAKANPDKDTPVMLDWEYESGLYPTIDDCDKVADAMRALGYRVPLLYTGAWYWGLEVIGRPTLAGRGLELVLSDYNTNPSMTPIAAYNKGGGDDAAEWSRSIGGLRPVLWQFGSRVRFGNLNWDMNAFRGTRDQLARWFRVPDSHLVDDPLPRPISAGSIHPALLEGSMETIYVVALEKDAPRDTFAFNGIGCRLVPNIEAATLALDSGVVKRNPAEGDGFYRIPRAQLQELVSACWIPGGTKPGGYSVPGT